MPAHSSTPDFRGATGILRRHLWLLLAFPIIGIALGLLYASYQEPTYEASAFMLVGEQQVDLAGGAAPSTATDAQRIGTEMEVLKSRGLIREVADSLKLQLDLVRPAEALRSELLTDLRIADAVIPTTYRFERDGDQRFRVIDDRTDTVIGEFGVGERIPLKGAELTLLPEALEHEELEIAVRSRASVLQTMDQMLDVRQPSADVNGIRVSYRGTDPELVRDVPNVLTYRFVELREAVQKTQARSTAALLREQLDTINQQLRISEDLLRSYREGNQIVNPELEASTQISNAAQLQAQRAALEADRASLAALFNEVRAEARQTPPGAPSPYRRLIAFPTLLENEAASELLRNLSEAENQRATLAARRSSEDTDLQAINSRIVEIEGQLQSIVTTYLQGITNQVNGMDASLGGYQARLNEMPRTATEFARLSRQPRVLEQIQATLQARLQEAEIAEAVDDAKVRVVDAAVLPSRPVGPGAPIYAGLTGLLGLILGIGFVFAREYADQAVHTRADVQAAIGIPVLGMIPIVKDEAQPRRRMLSRPKPALSDGGNGREKGRLLPGAPNGGTPTLFVAPGNRPTPVSDAYNRLHTNIMFAQPDAEMKTILITSPLPGDGKTSTAVNLAVTLAQSGLKVLLIDADLRRGRVHEQFGAAVTPGLADLLAEGPVAGVLRTADVGSGKPLRYITGGSAPSNPVQLLSSSGMRALLEGAVHEYDRVIIDTPPLNLFPDAVTLSAAVDGVVIVARAGVTPFDALVDTAEQLRHANTRVIGAVLNGIDFERDVSYDTSYRWYQYGKAYAHTSTGV